MATTEEKILEELKAIHKTLDMICNNIEYVDSNTSGTESELNALNDTMKKISKKL